MGLISEGAATFYFKFSSPSLQYVSWSINMFNFQRLNPTSFRNQPLHSLFLHIRAGCKHEVEVKVCMYSRFSRTPMRYINFGKVDLVPFSPNAAQVIIHILSLTIRLVPLKPIITVCHFSYHMQSVFHLPTVALITFHESVHKMEALSTATFDNWWHYHRWAYDIPGYCDAILLTASIST